MQRIDESVRRVFGGGGLPKTLSLSEFAGLTCLTPEEVALLIEEGSVRADADSGQIEPVEYYRYVFKENLAEENEDPGVIAHVIASTRPL